MNKSYKEFYNLLLKYKMITPIWGYELDLINEKLNSNNKDVHLGLFAIYFSLICSGNICMSLTKKDLEIKWEEKVSDSEILATDEDRFTEDQINEAKNDFKVIREISKELYNHLDDIKDLNVINKNDDDHEIFVIKDNFLYLRKYDEARLGIIESIKRLYLNQEKLNNVISFDMNDCYAIENFLEGEQKDVVDKGLNNNLVVTGGPGTGKTTSILFLLISLLSVNLDYHVYLAAASGKAASRMKESIINGIEKNVKKSFIDDHKDIFDKINGTLNINSGEEVEEFTIHRLLGHDFKTNGFEYNKKHQFPEKSIFIIDEASMIDVCLFNSLLEAIPDKARVFILGDKDQLPSVEVGSVFGDLVSCEKLKDKVITLVKSRRFDENTEVYKFAKAVNENEELTIPKFDKLDDFEILGTTNHDMWEGLHTISYKDLPKDNPYVKEKEEREKCSIKYYLNDNNKVRDGVKVNQKEKIKDVAIEWASHFYKHVQEDATNLDLSDQKMLDYVFSYTEEAKILCAENEGIRGVKTINDYIKKKVIKKKEPVLSFQYPGQVMMINKNNKSLKLYNGDTGILVSIKNDDTIYFMVKKNSKLKDDYKKDEIFKIGQYLFYPLRLITLSEIDLSFAITVHKSQGSDYDHVLIILPTAKGHPLLNRQILYTAVTRTKGYTYIVSNKDSLNEAKERLITRDTNIIL